MPRDVGEAADAARTAIARAPRPAVVGAVVVVVWMLVVAALPGGESSTGNSIEVVSKGLAATGDQLGRRPAAVLRVYVDPQGSDLNNGAAPERAVRSLAAAQRVIAAARPSTDVEVRIKQGTYVAAPLEWSTYVPGRTIAFLPSDYQVGASEGLSGRPVFQGNGNNGFWFRAVRQPGNARLAFYFLRAERYSAGAIAFDGGSEAGGQQTGNNVVYGMAFRNLGSKHAGGIGYGAVDLINSQNNVIQRNSFEYLENLGDASEEALVHGVYLSHHSSDNLIRDNRFRRISGDPIRTRDGSSGNKVFGNTFERTGSNAYFSDWFSADASTQQRTGAAECASRSNTFYDNILISGYRGPVEAWWTSPLGADYATRGCGDGAQVRVQAWGNRRR
ncbi:MAG TPA: right-handed parallel beta-helix repeat-containing protein [Streptosporangiaceae bacterium]|jgi:hypothetical protein